MRGQLRRVADLTEAEKAAVRTLALAVYPPEVAAAWSGRTIEFLIVPRGVEHRPVAEEEAQVLLFEPASTPNTGNVRNERTVGHLDRI
jgi:hypothetical protein